MFQFPACPPVRLWIHLTVTGSSPAGFPHSDIHGSKPACGSPWLFAACHVLLRRMVPGHPPCALCSLIISSLSDPETNFFGNPFGSPQLAFPESFFLCSCQGACPQPALRALKTIQSSSRLESSDSFSGPCYLQKPFVRFRVFPSGNLFPDRP